MAYHRIEDALPRWRLAAADTQSDSATPLASACLAWMEENGTWPNRDADKARVVAEIAAGTRRLITASPEPEASGEVPPAAWAAPAAIGAGLGALMVSPLTGLWFENKPIGFFAGGMLGAYGLVRGLAALLDRPRLVAALRTGAAVSAGGVAVRGFWQVLRGQSLGWARSVLWLAAAPLVLQAIQPRPDTPSRPRRHGASPTEAAAWTQAVDLTLAIAWSHPERLPKALDARPAEAKQLSAPVLDALSQLRAELGPDAAAGDARDAAEVLLQRLEEAGFDWALVARGTPYDADMAALFDTFGVIPPGAPIRTQRPAVTHHGEVVHKGELRRI